MKARQGSHLHDRVHLLFQVTDLGHMLADSLLKVQDATALLLRVAGDLQLEADTLLFLAVLLGGGCKKKERLV